MCKRIVVIGDIDNRDFYHVGDEAMLEANLIQLRQHDPDLHITVISADPSASAELYQAASVPRLGFPPKTNTTSDDSYQQRLDHILEIAQKWLTGPLDHTEPLYPTLDALYQADALIISGGGNMSSTWPEHLYERIALIRIAVLFHKKIVITGQTIGPTLTPRQQLLLSNTLEHIAVLGMREPDSVELIQHLGATSEKISFQLDDAFFLPPQSIDSALPFDIDQPFIAVTISPFTNPATDASHLDLLAEQLEAVRQITGVQLVFVPHVGQVHHSPLSDVIIAEYLKSKVAIVDLPIYTAREVVWLASKAALVISTRYHPLVFALAAQVPCIGLYTDSYTRTKLIGTLNHAGLEHWAMPIEAAVHGLLTDAIQELWTRRAEICQHLADCQPYWEYLYATHWSKMIAGLGLDHPAPTTNPAPKPNLLSPHDHWVKSAQILDIAKQNWESQFADLKTSFLRAEEFALSLEKALTRHRDHLQPLISIIQARETEITALNAVHQSTHHILGARESEIAALQKAIAATQIIIQSRDAEIAALKSLVATNEQDHALLQEREAELAEIKASILYRLNRKLDRFLPSRHGD